MKHKEILEKAIQKAIDGGWKHAEELNNPKEWTLYDSFPAFADQEFIEFKHPFIELEGRDDYFTIKELLFDHDFAKALWGESKEDSLLQGRHDPSINYSAGWQYHLQQMVIAEDPIAYLGENI